MMGTEKKLDTEHTRLVAANPSCENYLMMDTCAGGAFSQEVLRRGAQQWKVMMVLASSLKPGEVSPVVASASKPWLVVLGP